MKLLLLETFYSNFEIELAKSISNDIEALVFNIGNILYLNGASKIIVHKKILKSDFSQRDIIIAKTTRTLYTETLRKIDNIEPSIEDIEYMAKYISFLRTFLINKKVEMILMHNDLRWQHSLAIKVCKELNVKYLITESGLFRPDTITIDFQGVNAYNSLPRDKEYYKDYDINKKELRSYKISKWINTKVNIKFSLFILLNKMGDILNINSKLKNKNYSLLKYIKLFIRQQISKRNNKNIMSPSKYIFVPLQVNTDSQILVHSDYKNMQEFISRVERDFYNLESDIKLIFKIHPMEKGIVEYKFDNRSITTDRDTNELIENSECVVTINSTVGLEAIKRYKKVLVLGNAFFKIDGISLSSSKETFKDDIKSALDGKVGVDNEAIDKFVQYLKYEYQINSDLFNWDIQALNLVKEKLKIY